MQIHHSQEFRVSIGDSADSESVAYTLLQGIEQAEWRISGGVVTTPQVQQSEWQPRRAGGRKTMTLRLDGLSGMHDALTLLQGYVISNAPFLVTCYPVNGTALAAEMVCTAFSQRFTGRDEARFSCVLESAAVLTPVVS